MIQKAQSTCINATIKAQLVKDIQRLTGSPIKQNLPISLGRHEVCALPLAACALFQVVCYSICSVKEHVVSIKHCTRHNCHSAQSPVH